MSLSYDRALPGHEITAKAVTRNGRTLIVVLIQQMSEASICLPIRAARYKAWVEDTGEILVQNVAQPLVEVAVDNWLDGYARGYDAQADGDKTNGK